MALMAFALPVRTGQASVMPSMKQSNPPDSGFGAITDMRGCQLRDLSDRCRAYRGDQLLMVGWDYGAGTAA